LSGSSKTLAELRDDPDSSPSLRLKASAALIDFALKANDLIEVAPQLARIEQWMDQHERNKSR
jgi:hypothetical protein